MITGRDAELLLRVWESGASEAPSVRALLMLAAAAPEEQPEALAQLSIGQRNAHLLSLRERMFGPTLDCLTSCPACGDSIHLTFAAEDVRAAQPNAPSSSRFTAEDYDVHFRVPNSADLIALEGETDYALAERRLLGRCVLEASTQQGTISADDLPHEVATTIARYMSELDPQAEVLLDIACPSCRVPTNAPFDIGTYLWTEIDEWARGILQAIHTIAAAYGWRESDILAMSATRRRAYLELILA